MKAKLYVCIILTALIAVFTISGCTEETTVVDKLAASTDEVIANVIENVTGTTETTTTAVTTVATETTVGETTTAPEATTKAEEVTEAIEVSNQTSDKANTSKADKTENNASTQKPNNTTTNKPSNTEKPKPVETRPKETQPPATEAPAVITDDTPLTFEQMNTAENMQKIVDACNSYFASLGMTYDESLDPSWAGWYYGWQGGANVFAERTLEENIQRNISGLKAQVDAIIIDYYGYEYTDIKYKTVYVVNELDGYYDIVFCYG